MSQTAETETRPSGEATIRVMLVDDSAVVRGLIRRFLDPDPVIEVVATAGNGEAAIKMLDRYDIDVIILDIEMPVMDGLTAIPHLLAAQPGVKIIMASTLTERNAEASLKAIAAGATDYVAKPSSSAGLNKADDFKLELVNKVRALGGSTAIGQSELPQESGAQTLEPGKKHQPTMSGPIVLRSGPVTRPAALAIGSSTGGPKALTRMLSQLDSQVQLPVFVTQHMPATFTALFARHLSRDTGRNVVEAADGMPVEAGHVYLAPGDRHMKIAGTREAPVIELNDGPKANFCRPAVDVMLRSLVPVYGGALLTVILTGMGHDGRDGCEAVVEAGGTVLAQDEESSVVWGMPGAVAQAGLCHQILDLDRIGSAVQKLTNGAKP